MLPIGEPRSSNSPSTPLTSSAKTRSLATLALTLLVALPYLPGVARNGFVWLDSYEIVEGALIATDWRAALALFGDDGNFAGYHRPIYSLLHSLDRALWGLEPAGFYASSLALHLTCVALVFRIGLRCGFGMRAALAWGVLFGLHPLLAPVAGLIHAKADLAVTALLLGSVLAFDSATLHAGKLRWLGGLALFVIAFHTKELAYVFPVALAFLYSTQRGDWTDEAAASARKILALCTLLAGAHAAWRIQSSHASYGSALGLLERVATFQIVYVDYLRSLLVPFDGSISDVVTQFSARPRIEQLVWTLGFFSLIGLQLQLAREHKFLRPWLLLYNLALLPVAQLVPILHFRADRFLYVPALALTGGLVATWTHLTSNRRLPWESEPRRRPPLAVLGLALYSIASGATIVHRTSAFTGDEALFERELARTPDYREGLSVLARHWDRSGDHARAQGYWQRALATYPGRISYLDTAAACVSASHNQLLLENYEEAYRITRSLEPRIPSWRARERAFARYNRAVAARRIGRANEALADLLEFAAFDPQHAGAQYMIGLTALELEKPRIAAAAFERYLALAQAAPDRARAEELLERARALAVSGDPRASTQRPIEED